MLRPVQPQIAKLHQYGASICNVLTRECCVSTTKHYDKTAVLWQNTTATHCDGTRTLACHICKTSSSRLSI